MQRSFHSHPLTKGLSGMLFLLTLLLACRQIPEQFSEAISLPENSSLARYEQADLQKMQWLAGMWKGQEAGRTTRLSFQFHNNNMLEILRMGGDGEASTLLFTWRDGRYYYGQNRQWAVTWIGQKDVRFDPLLPGLEPMTWTRVSEQEWHLVRHAPEGDETTVMERTDELQP